MTASAGHVTASDAAALIARYHHTLIITINRPQARYAVNSSASVAVGNALERAHHDQTIWAVVPTGAGEKSPRLLLPYASRSVLGRRGGFLRLLAIDLVKCFRLVGPDSGGSSYAPVDC